MYVHGRDSARTWSPAPAFAKASELRRPPFGKRLANLGYSDIPPIEGIRASAIDELPAKDAVQDLVGRFDEEWRKKAQERVGIGG